MTLSPAMLRDLERIKPKMSRKPEPSPPLQRQEPSFDVGAVLGAAAVNLGFHPRDTKYLNRYIADVENQYAPQITCVRCGRVGLKEMSIIATDPAVMLRSLAELNGRIRPLFAILREKFIERRADPSVVLCNGFCAACIETMAENMPAAFRVNTSEKNEFEMLRHLVAECAHLGITKEAIYNLSHLVREHTIPYRETGEIP